MKKYLRLILFGFIVVVALLFLFAFNNISNSIHLQELQKVFQDSNQAESNIDHIGLIMNYKINKKLYDQELSLEEANLKEFKLQTILAHEEHSKQKEKTQQDFYKLPVLAMINLIRSMTGKSRINREDQDNSSNYLSIAYYYERNKNYQKALQVYEKALDEMKDDSLAKTSIFLHQGFCNAMMGNYEKAKKYYQQIIQSHADEDLAMTAIVLMKYLDGFNNEVKRVIGNEGDQILKSEKLYKLLAYQESLKILKKVEIHSDKKDLSRIKYLQGRCNEELGNKKEAILAYQGIIHNDQSSKFAKAANSRIFIVGSRSYDGQNIKKLALKNNELIKDDNFQEMLKDNFLLQENTNLKILMENSETVREIEALASSSATAQSDSVSSQDILPRISIRTCSSKLRIKSAKKN